MPSDCALSVLADAMTSNYRSNRIAASVLSADETDSRYINKVGDRMTHVFRQGTQFLIVYAFIILFFVPAFAERRGAPTQLHGKSIVISWSENRVQRNVGEVNFRSVAAQHEFRIYVSTAGRVFSRLINTTRRGTGARDQVGGSGGAHRHSFEGQTLTVFIGTGREPGSGVRRLIIDFDGGSSSCSANVVRAKQEGSSSIMATSLITGKKVEIQSVAVGHASCTVRTGNVFGGE